jgi:membrane protein
MTGDDDNRDDTPTSTAPIPVPAPAPDPDPGPNPDPAPRERRRRQTLRGIAAVRPPPARGIRRRVRDMLDGAVSSEDDRKRIAIPVYALRVTIQVVRQWARDRCPQQAASLAFQTVLSIAPLLALALALLRATGNLDAESTLVQFVAETYIPMSHDEIASTLLRWSENITFETLGIAGLILTLGVAFIMFNTLERIMNDIWRTERRRTLAHKLVVFYAVATVLPLVAGTVLIQAQSTGVMGGFTGWALGFGVGWFGAFACIYILPKTDVHLRSAAAGAVVSALLFEIAKALFKVYASEIAFSKYTGIYGAVAIAPILLIWIYYSWLVLLLGCEVAYAAQHLQLLERGERPARMSLERELIQRVNGMTAARVMVAIAEAYLAGKKVLSRRAIGDRFDLSDEAVDRIATRLKERDLILEVSGDHVGLMPAAPPMEIRLSDILAAFRGEDVLDTQPHPRDTRLDRVLRDIETDTAQRTRDLYLDQLIETE